MVHTIALIGANGHVGKPTLQHLVRHVVKGDIKLVVFHRPGSAPADVKTVDGVELRELDVESASLDEVKSKVQGIQVLIVAVTAQAGAIQIKLIDALAQTPGFITLVPSAYTIEWSKKDLEQPQLGPFLKQVLGVFQYAKSKGVATTRILTGQFDAHFLLYGVLGTSINANEITANEEQLKNPIPIVLLDHFGATIADLVSRPNLEAIKNEKFSVVTYEPTGAELRDLFAKINGKAPTIKPWGEEEEQAAYNDGGMGPLRAGYAAHWTDDEWLWVNLQSRKFTGAPSLEDLLRRYV